MSERLLIEVFFLGRGKNISLEFIEGSKCFSFLPFFPAVSFITRAKTFTPSIVLSSKYQSFNHLKKDLSDWYRD